MFSCEFNRLLLETVNISAGYVMNRKCSYNEHLHVLHHFAYYVDLSVAMNYGTAFSPPLSGWSRVSSTGRNTGNFETFFSRCYYGRHTDTSASRLSVRNPSNQNALNASSGWWCALLCHTVQMSAFLLLDVFILDFLLVFRDFLPMLPTFY